MVVGRIYRSEKLSEAKIIAGEVFEEGELSINNLNRCYQWKIL